MKKLFQIDSNMTFVFIFAAFLLLNQTISAQIEKSAIKRISSEQGLSNDGVTDIIRDKKGFMWFGTAGGLNRFDGYNFKIFKPNPNEKNSLTSVFINNLYIDSYGIMWINNTGFLYRYNNATNSLNHLLQGTWLTTMCEDTLNPSGPGMWFATYGQGLYWWNRIEDKFTHYFHKDGESASLISDSLLCVLTDANGNLWIGTSRGLNSLDTPEKKFNHYFNGPKGHVYELNVDQFTEKGLIWIGAQDGLYAYDVKSGQFHHYINQFAGKNNSNDNDVRTLYLDSKGFLWVGMIGGIGGFDTGLNKYFTYDNEIQSYPWAYITKAWLIEEDKLGTIWALAHGAGPSSHPLLRFDYLKNRFFHYPRLPGQTIYAYSMYFDKLGTLWLGTEDRGVLQIDSNKKPFYNYFNKSEKDRNFDVSISGFSEDSTGEVWIGSTYGLYAFNPNTGIFTHYVHSDIDHESLSSNFVHAVLADHSGNIWIGTDGLDIFNRKKNRFLHFINNPADSNSISSGPVVSLLESRDRTIWIALNNGTLDECSLGSKVFKHHYTIAPVKIFGKNLWFSGLVEGKDGLLWLTITGSGLVSYNRFTNSFHYYTDTPKPYKLPVNLSVCVLNALSTDGNHNLWISTDIGAIKYDLISGELSAITEQDGIADQYIYAITEDNRGYIWLGTAKGISRLDPGTRKFRNYDLDDGLTMGKINIGSVYKTSRGEIYFGGNNGFVHFFPDSLKNNDFIPPVFITSFKISNAEVQLDSSISFKKNIYLNYLENNLSFEFTSLNYTSPEKNQYAYKMEGIDKDWVYSGTRRFASYPNLDPGKYIFRVKGSNNDGIWNEEGTSISIIISPPWWKSFWAYSSYALIFVFSLYGIRRYELNRLRLKDKVKMDEIVLKEREETDKMKSTFFANISHEFRTPLTLILGPAEKISSKTSDDVIKDANVIKRNSRRLLQLINQLLDLSKLEAGKLKLEASKGNIVSFVKGAALSFESLAESKDINLKINSEKDFIELYFDKEKMMKILTNILSNAFKFTPEEGAITVLINTVQADNTGNLISYGKIKFVEIKIKDTGIGIANEEIPKLFDRFYQIDSSLTREFEGTGIGLALTKELIELHHGSIKVESEKGSPGKAGWTEFILKFPLGRDHLKEDEIVNDEKLSDFKIPIDLKFDTTKKDEKELHKQFFPIESDETKEENTIILIVEDNYDMRQYIRESLEGKYLLEEAVNGEQGVRKAEKIIPDLIISDMMMPKMDGNELVRILKNDEKTSHIPIILLTAKAGYEDKLEGLETGADDYLTKPFDLKELQVRIKNLINIRKKLQEKFGKTEFKPGKKSKPRSPDEKFMIRVHEIIEKHIAEEEFDMEEFGEELNMSRMQVHRKLKALTGKSANRYIRSFKLQKAKRMIEEKQGNISEIAYTLGFGSPAYFTKCFKDQFGYSPSEIIE